MSSLLAETIPLALAAAISPLLFLLQLNTLTGPRALSRGSALTAGTAVVLIVVSTIGVALGGTGFSGRESLQAVNQHCLWSAASSGGAAHAASAS